jgi:protoheme IX farnesyltransferase
MSGWLYLAGAAALGAGFVYWAVTLLRNQNPRAPMETFRYSIVYLGLLFVVLLIDHYVMADSLGDAAALTFNRL